MPVYFAHPTKTYGSLMEKRALELIREFFGSVEVVNPADYSRRSHSDMGFFYSLIDGCNAVVFTSLAGFVTSGVADEVEYALKRGKDVYYMDWRLGDLKKISDLNGFDKLSFRDTLLLYDFLARFDVGEVRLICEIDDLMMSSSWLSRVEALREVIDRYVRGDRYAHGAEGGAVSLDPVSRFYHWWMDEKSAPVEVDLDAFRGIIDEKMREFGASNLFSLCNKLSLPLRSWSSYYRVYTRRTRRPTISTLIRMCDELGIPYYELERRDLFMGKYPYDLGNPALWKVASHVINEGHLHRSINRVEYANMDPVLHLYFREAVEESGGVFYKPRLSMGRIFVSYADGFTMRRLHMLGLQYGRKVLYQPNIDLSVLPDEVWKYYVSTTLTEDGYAVFSLQHNYRLRFQMGWARSVDITDYVPEDIVSILDRGKSYNLAEISIETGEPVPNFISRHPPRHLMNEFRELIRRHGQDHYYHVDPSSWPRPRPSYIHVSKNGRVTVVWDFRTSNLELIRLFHDKYGMLKGTWKSDVFEKYYNFYINNLGKKLSGIKLEQYHDLKRKYPYRISRDWVTSKYRELFW